MPTAYRYVLIVSVIFLLVRLPFLDQLYLLHDEQDVVFTGYSLFSNGTDLFGHKLPVQFTGINPDNPLFGIYFSALTWFLAPARSVFWARLPFVLISTSLVYLVYALFLKITADKKLSLLTAGIFCFSPWIFHLTRLGVEVPLALVTLCLALLLHLNAKRGWAYLFYFITFYSYQGFRIMLPFLILYQEIFFFLKDRSRSKLLKHLALNLIFILLLLGSVFLIDRNVTQSRYEEVVFLNQTHFDQDIVFKRNSSLAPTILKQIFHNKFTAAVDYLLTTLVKGLDVSYLFKTGDYNVINGNAVGGQFFLPLIIAYYLGFIAMGIRRRPADYFILGWIGVGLLPSMASLVGTTYSFRSLLSALGYAYLIALGVHRLLEFSRSLKSLWLPRLILLCFSLVLFISLSYFTYNYYFRRPLTVSEIYNENERQLAQFLIGKQTPFTVYSAAPRELAQSYRFLNQSNVSSVPFKFLDCKELKNVFVYQHLLVSEKCLSKDQYDQLTGLPEPLPTIPYKDYSNRQAYFIYY